MLVAATTEEAWLTANLSVSCKIPMEDAMFKPRLLRRLVRNSPNGHILKWHTRSNASRRSGTAAQMAFWLSRALRTTSSKRLRECEDGDP